MQSPQLLQLQSKETPTRLNQEKPYQAKVTFETKNPFMINWYWIL
jgi:hypothetical protein